MPRESSLVKKLQSQLLSGLDTSLLRGELGEALKSWLVACKVEGKADLTLAGYHERVKGFLVFLETQRLPRTFAKLKTDHVRLYMLSRQQKGIQDSTLNTEYRALRRFFAWCIGEGLTKTSPMANIKPPKLPEKEPEPLTREQVGKLLVTQSPRKSTFLSRRNTAVLLVFTDTGLRLSEVAKIQLADFDADTGQIRVMGKGKKARVAQLGDRTLKALLQYLILRADDYPALWVTEERRPLTRNGLRIMLARTFTRAHIEGVPHGGHVFRHTFAMESFQNGAREFEIQLLLGHSTLAMTRRYMKKLDSNKAAKAHRMFSPVDNMLK